MTLEQFVMNRNAVPPEKLARFLDKHVAWSPDGLRILANDEDPLKLIEAVKALGYDPAEMPIEDISAEATGFCGGLLFQGRPEARE